MTCWLCVTATKSALTLCVSDEVMFAPMRSNAFSRWIVTYLTALWKALLLTGSPNYFLLFLDCTWGDSDLSTFALILTLLVWFIWWLRLLLMRDATFVCSFELFVVYRLVIELHLFRVQSLFKCNLAFFWLFAHQFLLPPHLLLFFRNLWTSNISYRGCTLTLHVVVIIWSLPFGYDG